MLVKLPQAVSDLNAWLSTWKDANSGIHGYVVHHHADAMKVISPDTWTQSATILGHLNLFEKTKEKKWLELAYKEAVYLKNNYISSFHIYKNSCFEQKPGSNNVYTSLIHNAYPSFAILRLCKTLKSLNKPYASLFAVAKDNVNNFIIKECWDKKNKVFSRGLKQDNVFVLNMASSAMIALIYLDELERGKNKLIEKYCRPLAKNIIELQNKDGSFPYDNTKTTAPLIYTALTIQGLIELYERTKNAIILESCKKVAQQLIKNIDNKTCFFYHRYVGKELYKFPQFLAGALVITHQLKRLEKYGIQNKETNKVINKVLGTQYENGAFPSFVGFSDIFMSEFYPAEPLKKKWRDVLPIPGWNALAFDSLTYCLNENVKLPQAKIKFPVTYVSEEFNIREHKDKVVFFDKKEREAAKWVKQKYVWEFGTIALRSGEERIKYSLYLWKKRLFFIKPLLNLIYPFRISKPD